MGGRAGEGQAVRYVWQRQRSCTPGASRGSGQGRIDMCKIKCARAFLIRLYGGGFLLAGVESEGSLITRILPISTSAIRRIPAFSAWTWSVLLCESPVYQKNETAK